MVAAGTFKLPSNIPSNPFGSQSFAKLPAFCRVQGVIAPSTDSHIEFEVWLPAAGWNGKYHGEGNGGFAGSINYSALAGSVLNGYASSSTDTATSGRHRRALGAGTYREDRGLRLSRHSRDRGEIQGPDRRLLRRPAKHSYFSSCSNGGRQALMEAQRYPGDYDGIIAGAPAASFTHIWRRSR